MNLPKLKVPSYTLTIPSSKKKVKFRPFLSNEEKVLMLVKQSENDEEILQAMKDIVNVCTFEKVDVTTLALFDLEYIFLQVRSKSVGEVIDIDMRCTNQIDLPMAPDHPAGVDAEKKSCGGLIPFSINIKDIKIDFQKDHTNTIYMEDDIGVVMRYPSADDLEMLEINNEDDIEIITNLMESIFDKDNVYAISETKKEDIDEFVSNMNSNQIKDIREKFFYTMPILTYTAKYVCPKCGNEGEYTFRGINDFF